MITTEQIAALLDKTADHIQQYGWTKNDFYDGRDGVDPKECPTCLRGGISAAAGHHPCFGDQPFEHAQFLIEVDDVYELGPADEAALELIRAAEGAFRQHLVAIGVYPLVPLAGELEEWNDAKDRTAEQVIREVRACASNLRDAEAAEVDRRLLKRALDTERQAAADPVHAYEAAQTTLIEAVQRLQAARDAEPHAHAGDELVYAGELVALAARDLAEATEAQPKHKQPVGWRRDTNGGASDA